ncbi:MAG: 4-aminobutyrate--2-oxoglutarate transaminase [Chloroflexales bacterium]|nr:4-aminobutyrate--2-oxoglutarate transaminase [Chloroflexales bacterium]
MGDTEARTAGLLAARAEHVARGVGNAHPIVVGRAEGARMWDVDGKEYIDFVGGIGVLNVGHNHPRVVQAVKAQLERVTHTCFQVGMYEPYIRLAERLAALAPGDFPKKAMFVTTGAEATENAVKIARAYTGRPGVVAFANSFHGRTLMGLTLTGKAKPYRQNFGPFAPEVYHAPFPYEYRGWDGERAVEGLNELFEQQCAPDRVAAVIIEPVLGEGGFVPAPPGFLQALREITARHGIVLIADEIQTGFGRTARLFAIEHSGVTPDLITVAKSMAGGLPLAAVVGRAEVMDGPDPGGLGGTYAGNPLACAAALAVLDIFKEERLLEQAAALGARLLGHLRGLQARHHQVGDVRGLGAMLAIELVRDRESKEPAPEIADHMIAAAREGGLILLKAGLYGNVIRILVPLNIEAPLLDKALAIFDSALERAVAV